MRNVFKLNTGEIIFQNKNNNTPKRAVQNLTEEFKTFYRDHSQKIRNEVAELPDRTHGYSWEIDGVKHFNFNRLVEILFVKKMRTLQNE